MGRFGKKNQAVNDDLLKDIDDEEEILDDKSRKSYKITFENKFFKTRERKVRNVDTGKVDNTVTELVVKSATLTQQLSSYGIYATDTERIIFGRNRSVMPMHALMLHYPQMLNNKQYWTPEMTALMEFLAEERVRQEQRAQHNIERGVIAFNQLWVLFTENGTVVAKMFEKELLGLQITSRAYGNSGFGEAFSLSGQCIKSTGKYFFWHATSVSMPSWDGLMPISSLRVQPPTHKTLKALSRRGKIYSKVAKGHRYMQYNGNMIYRKQWGSQMYASDGRLMVDIPGFLRVNPGYQEFNDPSAVNVTLGDLNSEDDAQRQLQAYGKMSKIPKEKRALTWPTVAGFSFASKVWGEILVSGLSEIQFDDNAFDQLVLDENKKSLVQALVANHKRQRQPFADIITGKGMGKIFLLHGPPGVGKTLTAEAIAEYLHQPLYSISVGELGVTVKELEAKLNEILEMAAIWNAVILIDEADIFLEQRTNADIKRNAMVGIFLRLLEYHQGVLFLTTNRVKVFDRAFHSRISVAIRYDSLNEEARARVWDNFLQNCGSKGFDTTELAKHEMNGRQIRTAVQLAQALAFAEGAPMLTMSYIKRTLEIATQFNKSFDWKNNNISNLLELANPDDIDE